MSNKEPNARSTVITMQIEDICPPRGAGRFEKENVPADRGAPKTTIIGKHGGFVKAKSANKFREKKARCEINGNHHTY